MILGVGGGAWFHFESVDSTTYVHFCWHFQRPLERLGMQTVISVEAGY